MKSRSPESRQPRFLNAEPLEERLVLSAAACALPFVSAVGLLEADTAFIGTPEPVSGAEPESVSLPASTASAGEFYTGVYYDVNKYRNGDSKLCWAAAMANVLVYTNWGYSTASSGEASEDWIFTSEYDIYDYFIANFTNMGGHAYYAFPWFTSGEYDVQGSSSWSQVTGDGGYLYPGISIPDVLRYLHYENYGETLIGGMTEYLEQGYGVVMAIGWYNSSSPASRSGGHSVTVWGYTCDSGLDPSDPNYYTGLIITNSDDSYTGLKTVALEWNEEYSMYRLSDFSGGRGWIEDFTCIKPVETLTGVSAAGYSGSYDGEGHAVTVSGIDNSGTDEYTVIYNYDGSFTLESPVYTDPGTYTVVVVAVRNEFDAIWSAPVTITISEAAGQLAAPAISSAAPAGLNRHTVVWTETADAAGYEIAWSGDGGLSWSSRTTAEPEALISGLTYGETILYRVRALGDGVNTADSDWSAETALCVNPMDIDADGFIGPGDYALLSSAWFAMEEDQNWDPRCDVDGDGFIGPGDFTYLSAGWFKSCENGDFLYPTV